MTDMTSWIRMWIPFSTQGKREKYETKKQLHLAQEMYEDSIYKREDYSKLYEEQKQLAEELRDQRRRNRFSDLFQQVPPKFKEED